MAPCRHCGWPAQAEPTDRLCRRRDRQRRQSVATWGIIGVLLLLLAHPVGADSPTGRCASTVEDDAPFELLYIGRDDVTRPREASRLRELSGLALQPDSRLASGFWMWLVDDGKRNLFRADVDGNIGSGDDNKIELSRSHGDDMEGILFRAADNALYAIQEDEYRIIRVDLSQGGARARVTGTFALSEMAGYGTVTAVNDPDDVPLATYISTSTEAASNQGLEGIAYVPGATSNNQGKGSFFVVKERSPGLLIEIHRHLDRILGFTILNCGEYPYASCPSCTCPEAGSLPFSDRVGNATRDFSGLSYDGRREKLWIASDASTAVFLYDISARTYDAFQLATDISDDCVQQVEGVAYVESLDILKVVSDRDDSAVYFNFGVAVE